MPFSSELTNEIKSYILGHLPQEDWYEKNFYTFIEDSQLRNRLITEFKNARFIYKLFEGLQATDELLLAQIKTQVVMYVSIQEAVIGHVLFKLKQDTEVVNSLLFQDRAVKYSIPRDKLHQLSAALSHDGKEVIPHYITKVSVDKTKIRYDQKVKACFDLNLISQNMMNDLITLYEYRNTIHIESELRKNLTYDLSMGELAFRKVEGLSIELAQNLK